VNAEKPQEAERNAGDRQHQTIEWFAPGQERVVEVNGVPVVVRFVGRKGRRARIAVLALSRSADEFRE
jgi:hypothetical protein